MIYLNCLSMFIWNVFIWTDSSLGSRNYKEWINRLLSHLLWKLLIFIIIFPDIIIYKKFSIWKRYKNVFLNNPNMNPFYFLHFQTCLYIIIRDSRKIKEPWFWFKLLVHFERNKFNKCSSIIISIII